jgi:uncharacterized protein YjbJ (UPF0337 family)
MCSFTNWRSKLREEKRMDKDRIRGTFEQAKGKAKELFGKLTGDTKTESEGKAEKVTGKAQNTIGGVKDKAREMTNDK